MPSGIYKHHSHQLFQKGHTTNLGRKHSKKFKEKMSEVQKGSNNSFWKNGEYKTSNGYIYITQPLHPFCIKSRYVLRSHLVAEKCLGRYLTKKEIIHHINNNTLDDKPENLYLFSSAGEHIRFHRLKNKPQLKSNL